MKLLTFIIRKKLILHHRRSLLAILVMIILLVGLSGAIYVKSVHSDDEPAAAQNSSVQTGGSLTVSASPPSSFQLSIGGKPPKASVLLEKVNDARTANGVSPVHENTLLNKSAKLKLDDMITRNYWAHNAPDGTQPWYFYKKVGYVYSAAGENLAYGHYKYYPEETVVDNWLNSPEHRRNMLNSKFTDIGIAIKKSANFNGESNVYVIVTHYGAPAM